MSQIYSIASGLPFCQYKQGKQTNFSIGLRITAVALGAIAAIVGVLILLNVPGLGLFGSTAGWIAFSAGTFVAIVGISLKCIQKSRDNAPILIIPEKPLEQSLSKEIIEVKHEQDKADLKEEKKLDSNLPTSYYTFNNSQLTLNFWKCNNDKANPIRHPFPVAASPEHGVAFLIGNAHQNIIFDDGISKAHIEFKKLQGATFMKPNVDTMLICCGILELLGKGFKFKQAIDIGAGSGFIAKYLALNSSASQITAIDIDPKACEFMNSDGANMPKNVEILHGDAIAHLSQFGTKYDLIVSNPPYVPNKQETQSEEKVEIKDKSFWEGTAMISHMLEDTLPNMPQGGHLIVVIPSTSLKSKRLAKIFQEFSPQYQARILYQQEVAYKAWFAGNNKVSHILATEQEKNNPTYFKGINLNLYVGITKPGKPRDCKLEDGRREYLGYYWQMVYIIDFTKKAVEEDFLDIIPIVV